MRVTGLFGLLGCLALASCSTGDSNTMPPSEAGNVQLGIVCTTFYTVTGTFTPNPADPPPADFDGCWPIGQWTFTLAKSTDESVGGGEDSCASLTGKEPSPLAHYQFTGSTVLNTDGDPVEQFTYNAQASDPNVHVSAKVTEGGTGVCQGTLSLFDSTGEQVWTLKPELNADNTINGAAEYDLYGSNQWGGDDN